MQKLKVNYKNRLINTGSIVNNIYKRKINSKACYWAFGGSLGIDLSLIDQLKTRGTELIEITVTDWGKTFQISFHDFLTLAKSTTFYGVKRLHVPFYPHWTITEDSNPVNSPSHTQNSTSQLQLYLAVDNTLEMTA